MSKYQEMKDKVRAEVIEWQLDFDNHNYSWGELAAFVVSCIGKILGVDIVNSFVIF